VGILHGDAVPKNQGMGSMAFSLTHLCTTYNYARFLPGHLESVRAQTRRPEQVVVSDDCSPRDTPEVVRAACAGYPEAEVRIQPTNLGSARHVFDLCNAVQTDAYIAMSADDLVADPNFYQDALRILEEDPSVVAVYGLFQHMNEQGRSRDAAHRQRRAHDPILRSGNA
jgi:GT2 family glycosyltransferase